MAVKVAKWAAIAGGVGVGLGVLAPLVPPLFVPCALLLLGFPVSVAALLTLPFLRAAERTVDRLDRHQRNGFLEERPVSADTDED